jgi:hypothetical protein
MKAKSSPASSGSPSRFTFASPTNDAATAAARVVSAAVLMVGG